MFYCPIGKFPCTQDVGKKSPSAAGGAARRCPGQQHNTAQHNPSTPCPWQIGCLERRPIDIARGWGGEARFDDARYFILRCFLVLFGLMGQTKQCRELRFWLSTTSYLSFALTHVPSRPAAPCGLLIALSITVGLDQHPLAIAGGPFCSTKPFECADVIR